MTLLERVQETLANAPFPNRSVFEQGPFKLLLDPDRDVVFINYAVPQIPPVRPESDLKELIGLFRRHKRTPRLEYIEDLFPELAEPLKALAFTLDQTLPIMACVPESFTPKYTDHAEVRVLTSSDDVRVYYRTANKAFKMQWPVSDEPVIKGAADRTTGVLDIAIAYVEDDPVGCACISPSFELSGVGVDPEHRRKGIASAVSSVLLERHFKNHGLVWLAAEDEAAEALYRGLGFVKVGTHTAWTLRAPV